MRKAFLRTYAAITCYPYYEELRDLSQPQDRPIVAIEESQEKAKASLTSVSALFAFAFGVLVAIAVWGKFDNLLERTAGSTDSLWEILVVTLLSTVLPFSIFWCERFVSRARLDRKKRRNRYIALIVLLVLMLLLLAFPWFALPGRWVLEYAFPLSGALMVVLSVFFLLSSLEFYEYASGWREGKGLHFHLASLGRHSFVLGASLVVVGLGLTLCLLSFFAGRVLTFLALTVVVVITEIERDLFDLAPEVETTSCTVQSITAAVHGTVRTNGLATNAWFDWGTASDLATFNSTLPQPAGSGAADVSVSASLMGLAPTTPYYYRVAGSNDAGTTKGRIRSFTSGPA